MILSQDRSNLKKLSLTGVEKINRQKNPPALQDAMWITIIWLCLTFYNILKAYHVDDSVHLLISKWIIENPFNPMSGMLYLGGVELPINSTNQPHLYFYILAIWGNFFGFSELSTHTLQSLFSLSAIILFYRLARHLLHSSAMWATALFALNPSFVVEQNLMVDVPLVAVWLLFFNALIIDTSFSRKQQVLRFALAGVACAAAILIKYSSLLLFPILMAVIVLERQWRSSWSLLIPLAALAAWSMFNLLDYGSIHIADRPVNPDLGPLRRVLQAVEWIYVLGAITPLGVVLAVGKLDWAPSRIALMYAVGTAGFLGLTALVASGIMDEVVADRFVRVAFAGNGAAILLILAVAALPRLLAWRTSPPPTTEQMSFAILVLWISGHFAFYVLFTPFMAVRHLLLVLPAIMLLSLGLLPRPLGRLHTSFGLIATIVLSTGLGWADWRFADFYREQAVAIRESLPADSRVWFTGYLSWDWYAAQAGMLPLNVQSQRLSPGDYLVEPENGIYGFANTKSSDLRFVHVRRVLQQEGIGDLFCTAKPNHFYITFFPNGPWKISRSCVNAIDIYRVMAPD